MHPENKKIKFTTWFLDPSFLVARWMPGGTHHCPTLLSLQNLGYSNNSSVKCVLFLIQIFQLFQIKPVKELLYSSPTLGTRILETFSKREMSQCYCWIPNSFRNLCHLKAHLHLSFITRTRDWQRIWMDSMTV